MKCNIMGKNFTVSDTLKDRIQSKFSRLDKLFRHEVEAQVTLKSEKLDQIIEVSIPLKKRLLRAEVRTTDMNASIDEIVDVLEKQTIKYKNKLRDRARDNSAFKEEFEHVTDDSALNAEAPSKIERVKRFALKPMDPEEAAMEMELLGHNFYVFRNGQTDEVSVVYKRKDGAYGLIEAE